MDALEVFFILDNRANANRQTFEIEASYSSYLRSSSYSIVKFLINCQLHPSWLRQPTVMTAASSTTVKVLGPLDYSITNFAKLMESKMIGTPALSTWLYYFTDAMKKIVDCLKLRLKDGKENVSKTVLVNIVSTDLHLFMDESTVGIAGIRQQHCQSMTSFAGEIMKLSKLDFQIHLRILGCIVSESPRSVDMTNVHVRKETIVDILDSFGIKNLTTSISG